MRRSGPLGCCSDRRTGRVRAPVPDERDLFGPGRLNRSWPVACTGRPANLVSGNRCAAPRLREVGTRPILRLRFTIG